ncbi:WSC domain-containing protein, partial [Cladochytrium replicatum]
MSRPIPLSLLLLLAPALVSAAPPGWSGPTCYTDSISQRLLTGKYAYNAAMTDQLCASTCAGYQYFGMEYSTECYCGNSFANAKSIVDSSQCSYKCGGNSNQMCGGYDRISLYTSTTPPPPTYGVSSPPSNWKVAGCYSDQILWRTLTAKYTSGSMTVEKCSDNCKGYKFFGVEYGNECYCGDTLSNGGTSMDASGCNMKCSGNSGQFCGGSNRLGLYETNSYPTSPSPSPSPKPSASPSPVASPSPSPKPSASPSPVASPSPSPVTSPSPLPVPTYGVSAAPSNWKVSGCYSDQRIYRTLTGKYTSGSMTVQKCADSCAGYKYFGVEYGDECYCGNVLANGGSSQDIKGCNMACKGNSKLFCGGSDRLGLYESTSPTVP